MRLHEIIAIVGGLKKTVARILAETAAVFKKEDHFSGQIRRYDPKQDSGVARKPDESKPLISTVMDKLMHLFTIEAECIDAVAKIDASNMKAQADVVLPDGKTLLTGVPVTHLLYLEGRVDQWLATFNHIPTTDPKYKWDRDDQRAHAYTTSAILTDSTRVEDDVYVTVPATDKHPAQTAIRKTTIIEGTWTTQYLSGKMTPAEKADILHRLTVLRNALKQARERANAIDVEGKLAPGEIIAEYVLGTKLEKTV